MPPSRKRSMKRFKADTESVKPQKLIAVPPVVPWNSLKTLIDEAARTDELMVQLVKTTKKLEEAEKKAAVEAAKLYNLIENLSKSESDLCAAKASLANNQRELLKLRGIHKICENQALVPTSVKSARARRLEQRNSTKSLGPGVLHTDAQIQEQINEAEGLIGLASERYKFKDELYKSLVKRHEQSQAEVILVRKQNITVHDRIKKLQEIHKKCISRVSAEVLPENVLLHIFQYLSKSVLMNTVGPVCKTWRRVSKDFSLWKNEEVTLHSSFAYSSYLREKACYLQIAPCLKSLTLEFPENHSKLDPLLSYCECKISKLRVVLRNFNHLELLTRLLKRQKQYLTELYIDDSIFKPLNRFETSAVRLLWILVGEMSKLKNLYIKNSANLLTVRCKASEFPSLALEEISIDDCIVHASSALSRVVNASSDSLQMLELPSAVDENVVESLALMKCSKLRVLRIPCLSGITAIENCSQLANLKICSTSPPLDAIPVVAAFLKSSPVVRNLEKFEVLCGNGMDCCNALAPAISSMPKLKELKLKGSSQYPVNNMLSLIRSLPLLEKLDCNTFPLTTADVDQFISTNILPKLEVLNIPNMFNNYEKHHCLLDLKDKRKNLILTGMYSDSMRCYCSDCYDSDSLSDYSTDVDLW